MMQGIRIGFPWRFLVEPIGLLRAARLPLIFTAFAQILKWESYDLQDVRMPIVS